MTATRVAFLSRLPKLDAKRGIFALQNLASVFTRGPGVISLLESTTGSTLELRDVERASVAIDSICKAARLAGAAIEDVVRDTSTKVEIRLVSLNLMISPSQQSASIGVAITPTILGMATEKLVLYKASDVVVVPQGETAPVLDIAVLSKGIFRLKTLGCTQLTLVSVWLCWRWSR